MLIKHYKVLAEKVVFGGVVTASVGKGKNKTENKISFQRRRPILKILPNKYVYHCKLDFCIARVSV